MRDEVPEPWRSAAERKGISPSYRPIGHAAGLAHETVRRLVSGRSSSPTTIRKVAEALGVDVERIHEWRSEAPPDYGQKFEPDPASSLLTTDERAILNDLIRMLVRGRSEGEEGERGGDTAPNTPAGGSPATVHRLPVRETHIDEPMSDDEAMVAHETEGGLDEIEREQEETMEDP